MRLSFEKILKDILTEETIGGGTSSVFGSGVVSTAGAISGDTYAPGDARIPKVIGGIYRRNLPKDYITVAKILRKKKKKKKKKN